MNAVRIAVLSVTLAACQAGQGTTLPLAEAPEPFRSIGHPIVLDLPDSGGFAINTEAVDSADLPEQLRAIYDPRPAELQAVFIRNAPRSRASGLRYVEAVAGSVGIGVYGYEETFPPARSFRTVLADSQ